jgi:hypothetical protein
VSDAPDAPHVPDDPDTSDVPDAPKVDVSAAADLKEDNEALIDRAQRGVNNVILATVQKTDNLFGTTGLEEEASVNRGRISVGGEWDQRDAFKARVRLKARVQLPALKRRASLVFGRGDADEFVDGTGDEDVDTLPNRFNDFEDDDWLLGVGFSRDAAMRRGWSFGAGVKLTTPVEPYVRATYRWHRTIADSLLWRVEPRFFVQSQRGAGLSLQNTLDYAANENWLLRWWTVAVADDPIEGVAWTTKLAAYRNLTHKSAISYAAYYSGETAYEVPVRDYGVELRFRRQISRDWLFIELLGRVSWPREFIEERRKSNLGVGIEFEMQFGQWPGRPEAE